MRYLFGFLCVCALRVVPLVGCSETQPECERAADCDDQNDCTEDTCDLASRTCSHTPSADGTSCDFGGAAGVCMSGACEEDLCDGIDCSDENDCTEDVCEPADGTCSNRPVEDDTACDFSGFPGLCKAGVCEDADGKTAGGPSDQVTCSEFSPCTVWLLGDSNTAAMGWNFATIDANHHEYDAVNLGRDGASSVDGLAHVESLLATGEAPEIAVVTYGGMDILESYSAAPQNATGPTDDVVDQIYANLEAICELLQPEGAYCVLGKSIGALTQLHPLDEGIPDGSIDFAALNYVDRGYVLLGEAIEERYQPGWVSFRMPKDFDLWGHGSFLAYAHLTEAGYSIMSSRLEAKLDDLIIDQGGTICFQDDECNGSLICCHVGSPFMQGTCETQAACDELQGGSFDIVRDGQKQRYD